MSKSPESREEAIKRLNEQADALEKRTERTIAHEIAGQRASGQAWRIIADLFGGVLVGVGLGAVVDWFLHSAPWGIIGGVLIGFALSIWLARQTANRIMAEAKAASGEQPRAVPFDDEEDA